MQDQEQDDFQTSHKGQLSRRMESACACTQVSGCSCTRGNSFLQLLEATSTRTQAAGQHQNNTQSEYILSMHLGHFPLIASLKEKIKQCSKVPQVIGPLVISQSPHSLPGALVHACDIVSVWILLSGTYPCPMSAQQTTRSGLHSNVTSSINPQASPESHLLFPL